MNEQLKALYDCFYKPLPATELTKKVKDCQQALMETLDKPERLMVIQIMDIKDQIAEDSSIDSFITGLRLGWQLSNELNMYEKTRLMMTPEDVAIIDAFLTSGEN